MLKRIFPFMALLTLLLLLVACGNSSTTTAGGSTPTAAPTATPTATTATASAVVMTTAGTVKGASKTILTDSKGMTLYYFTPDTASTTACTGGCATSWPPLLFSGSGTPTSSGSLSGTLTTVTDANGAQVAYNGHLLYTFAGDTAAGQTNGEGVGGKWFVATDDLTALSASGGSSSAVVKTATATIKGASKTILTNSKGMTLYYFTPDTASTTACTGGCASSWPPLLFTGSGTPTSSGSLSGILTTVTDANGAQVAYNGHMLYTFSGDSAAGQTNGEGVGGKWFVATDDVSTLTAATSGSGY